MDMPMKNGLRVNVLGALLLTVLMAGAAADSPVADAAQRGDVDAVRSLLQRGADVNAAQGDGMSALHWAAKNGAVEMARILIYAGASPSAITRLGEYTPLLLAAESGQSAVLSTLLEGGSDVHASTSTGASALHLAAAAGRADAVAMLLQYGADVDRRESANAQTPLMWATAGNRLEAVAALLEAGADVAITTAVLDYRLLAEQDASDQERRDRVASTALAVQQEADEERRAGQPAPSQQAQQQSRQVQPPAPSSQLVQPQQTAQSSQPGQPSPTAQPQQGPATIPELLDLEGGLTALHYAARDGYLDAAKMLIAEGADVNQGTDADNTSPLLIAAVNGNYDLAMYLLDQGADANLVSDDGASPLFATLNNRWAPKAFYPQPTAFKQQETSYLDLMEALLDAGAEVNHRLDRHLWFTSFGFGHIGVTFEGATAFWRAAYATDVPAMQLLIARGADPNIPTTKVPSRRGRPGDGRPEGTLDPSGLPPIPFGGPAVYPIHAASGVGYGVARAGNAHRHVPDGWIPAVRYLVEELGADVNQLDHDGYSPVHHAASRGDNELILYLVSRGANVSYVARSGQTTVDMANGPQQRVQPFPSTIALLEGLGAINNYMCVSC
jgi:ankyrin repeat protein